MSDWETEIAGEKRMDPLVHPGEVLRQERLEPLEMNPSRPAEALGVDRQSVHEIVGGKRRISADVALRLARWSGIRPGSWLGLQTDHDHQVAESERGQEIAEQVKPLAQTI